ncbi:unnamed protein product [Amoebophrya sp. A120]|nr:unnamed protein product [Amoebophrya sp. A120]|eukprot:GSA120T00011233001.1
MPVLFYGNPKRTGGQQVQQSVSAPALHAVLYLDPEVQQRAPVPGQVVQQDGEMNAQARQEDKQRESTETAPAEAPRAFIKGFFDFIPLLRGNGREQEKQLAPEERHLFESRGTRQARGERHQHISLAEQEHDCCDSRGAPHHAEILMTNWSAFVDVFDEFSWPQERHDHARRRPTVLLQHHFLHWFFLLALVLVLSPALLTQEGHNYTAFAVKVVQGNQVTSDHVPGDPETSRSAAAVADSSTTAASVMSAHRMSSPSESGTTTSLVEGGRPTTTGASASPGPGRSKRVKWGNLRGIAARQQVLAVDRDELNDVDSSTRRSPHSWLAAFSAFLETLRADYFRQNVLDEAKGPALKGQQEGRVEQSRGTNDGQINKPPPATDSHLEQDGMKTTKVKEKRALHSCNEMSKTRRSPKLKGPQHRRRTHWPRQAHLQRTDTAVMFLRPVEH